MIFFGIDAGFSGAVAILEPSTGYLEIHDMPVMPAANGKVELAHHALLDLLAVEDNSKHVCILEKVSARPKQGVVSVFRFGECYGAIQMAIAASELELKYVTPQTWKRYFGLTSDKDTSMALACQRFPKHAHYFKRKKDDGRAEATLIALWGSEVFK